MVVAESYDVEIRRIDEELAELEHLSREMSKDAIQR
jgi:hypothetical protein